jgi:hypothetical protein
MNNSGNSLFPPPASPPLSREVDTLAEHVPRQSTAAAAALANSNSNSNSSGSSSVGIGMTSGSIVPVAFDQPSSLFSTLYIPVVCSTMRAVTIKTKESLSFGEIVQGTTCIVSLQVFNCSAINALHYQVVYSNDSVHGSIHILSDGITGVIPPSGSGYLQIEFKSMQAGKFEQEMKIISTKDASDWVRVGLSSTVTIPQSQLVEFPDLMVDETGSDNRLDLGQIQIPHTNRNSNNKQPLSPHSDEKQYKYPFRILNIYKKILFV